MSSYMNYDTAAANIYDQGRIPVGIDIIRHALVSLELPATGMHLLDAGCGVGLYARCLTDIAPRIHLLDISMAMLNAARNRLSGAAASGHVNLCRASLLSMPYPDGSFDAALVNQVLHHVENGEDRTYEAHRRAIREVARVLKPGGLLIINACTHAQLRSGFWYYALIPQALQRTLAYCADDLDIVRFVEEAGLQLKYRYSPLQGVLQGDRYFDLKGPLDPAWRSLDSIWALASDDEVLWATTLIAELTDSARLAGFFREHDHLRTCVGQTTLFVATKSGASGQDPSFA